MTKKENALKLQLIGVLGMLQTSVDEPLRTELKTVIAYLKDPKNDIQIPESDYANIFALLQKVIHRNLDLLNQLNELFLQHNQPGHHKIILPDHFIPLLKLMEQWKKSNSTELKKVLNKCSEPGTTKKSLKNTQSIGVRKTHR